MVDLIQHFFQTDGCNIIQRRNWLCVDFCLTVTLDVFQLINFTSYNKRKCLSDTTGTTGTADTVHIKFIILRHIIIKHCLYIIYINTTGCHIGGDQDLCFAAAEAFHNTVSLALLHISMQTFRKISPSFQCLCQLIHTFFCIAEYKGELWIVHIQKS